MSRTVEEQLSALLDAELPVEEEELLLRRLERDGSHRETLARYSLIGECIRGAATEPAFLRIGDRVRADVERENIAPSAPSGRRIGRGLLGAGIAAGIAVLALVTIDRAPLPGVPAPAPVSAAGGTTESVSAGYSYIVPESVPVRGRMATVRLTNYLVSHGEFTNGMSRQVMDSYIVRQLPAPTSRESGEGFVGE